MILSKKEEFKRGDVAWDQDELDRQNIANYLTPILDSIRQPFVISLNSPYGTGKSFFIKNWKQQLENDGYKVVYFNAWETDYAEDALVAFISSIKNQMCPEDEPQNSDNIQKLNELFSKAKPYLNTRTLPVFAKIIFRLLIGSKTLQEFVDLPDSVDAELTSLIGNLSSDSLARYEEAHKSVEGFRIFLEETVKELVKDIKDENKKKIVIFVDELDRCKPTYAIEILECIKHLFSVPGLVFILAVDTDQLGATVSSMYGLNKSGEGYLTKFIDWQLNLPKPSAYKYSEFMFNHFNLIETKKFESGDFDLYQGKQILIGMVGMLANTYELSLRQLAHIFTEINLHLRSPQSTCIILVSLISVMKYVIPLSQLKQYCLGECSCEPLLDKIENDISSEEYKKSNFREWVRMKPILHAMFLTEELYMKLHNENDLVIQKINEFNKAGTHSEEKHTGERFVLFGKV